eukprot:gene7533-10165_t
MINNEQLRPLSTFESNDSSKQYKILEKIGEGTFGEVRKALDTVSGKYVAIKYLPAVTSASSGNSFLKSLGGLPISVFRELESLKCLSGGQGIIRLHDVFVGDSSLCLVMDLMVSDLSRVIESATRPLPRNRIKSYFRMILEAVSFCHSKYIIHRDIKPANFLLDSNGSIKLADFGLARVLNPLCPMLDMTHQVATR